jgi:ornithine cyclodeaminase/alanine dehydrogenase-like protein (mu-crystallin family)
MQAMDVRVISGSEVRALLPYPDCVKVVEGAMKAVSAGKALMPLRQFMPLPVGDGKLAWMPGYLGEPPCFGIKILSLYPGNPAVGLSSHVGLYVLYESSHGRPIAILEASALTAVRTAAGSVVATRALARSDAKTLAIVGTGEEAYSHVDAFQSARPFERVLIWGRNAQGAARLAEHAAAPGRCEVEVVPDVKTALAQADVICTVTSAPEPLLFGRDVRPGTHLCLVGSSIPTTREVDDDCVALGRFFVDYRGSALAQAGELLHAIRSGRVTEAHIVAEIGEVLSGSVPGRRSADEVTIYKSLGVAAQDLAAATFVHQRAVALDKGTVAPI